MLAVVTLAVSNARIAAQEAETARALAEELEARAGLDEARARERRSLYLERVALASRLWSVNQVSWADRLDECPREFRYWEWDFLNALRRPQHLMSLDHGDRVYAVAYSGDGRHLASAGEGGAIKRWDAATGRALPYPANHGDAVTALAFRAVSDFV